MKTLGKQETTTVSLEIRALLNSKGNGIKNIVKFLQELLAKRTISFAGVPV